jgi:preprotein translocase subunit YajC
MPLISDAFAQGAAASGSDQGIQMLVMMAALFAFFYFVIIRPQTKRQKELKAMVEALSKGDEVVTTGGLVGKITDISDQYLTLQVATVGGQPVAVSIQRSSVATLLPKGSMKSL